MLWKDLMVRAGILVTLFFLIVSQTDSYPIVELFITIIIVSQMILYKLSKDDQEQSLEFFQKGDPQKMGMVYVVEILAASYFMPVMYMFMPVFCYDIYLNKSPKSLYLLGVILWGVILNYSIYTILFVAGFSIIASTLYTVIFDSNAFEKTSYEKIDTLRDLNDRIKSEQTRLVTLQDELVQASRLEERKRISEEIHDIIGHQLSSSIIQLGALEYVVEDENVKGSLSEVKGVLDDSMDNLRDIIYAERQTTINLETELHGLVDNFTKSPIELHYDNQTPVDNQTAHTVVSIVSEALSNINKHSNATLVTVKFMEMRDKWTLLVVDNGTLYRKESRGGIGLLNIEERVKRLKGTLHINAENGFRIFVSLPMKGEE